MIRQNELTRKILFSTISSRYKDKLYLPVYSKSFFISKNSKSKVNSIIIEARRISKRKTNRWLIEIS